MARSTLKTKTLSIYSSMAGEKFVDCVTVQGSWWRRYGRNHGCQTVMTKLQITPDQTSDLTQPQHLRQYEKVKRQSTDIIVAKDPRLLRDCINLAVTQRQHEFGMVAISLRGRDSSVGTVTRYGVDGPRIQSRSKRDFPYPSRPVLRPIRPPVR